MVDSPWWGSSLHGNTKGNVSERVGLEEIEMVRLGQFTYMEYERKGFKTKQNTKKSVKEKEKKKVVSHCTFLLFF